MIEAIGLCAVLLWVLAHRERQQPHRDDRPRSPRFGRPRLRESASGAVRPGIGGAREGPWSLRLSVLSRGGLTSGRRRRVDLGVFVVEVSARVRSGESERNAWRRTAERHGLPAGIVDGEPAALRALATGKGSGGAARGALATARLAHELGAPLADLLDNCAEVLTQTQAADDARRIAFAGPVASARLLAGLPAVGVLLGTVVGADPLASVTGGGLGTVAAMAGLVLLVAGIMWSRTLIRAAAGAGDAVGPAVEAHLVAGALRAGAPIPRALVAVGRATGDRAMERAGGLLSVGARWEDAWDEETLVSRSLEPAWCDGANPVPLLVRAARSVLAGGDREARQAAARLSVRLVIPLGVCFVPAFIALGVLPVVIALAGDIWV